LRKLSLLCLATCFAVAGDWVTIGKILIFAVNNSAIAIRDLMLVIIMPLKTDFESTYNSDRPFSGNDRVIFSSRSTKSWTNLERDLMTNTKSFAHHH
jgi:hypothetical protein